MKPWIAFSALLVPLVSSVALYPSGISPNLKFIAAADGKNFFVELVTGGSTWAQAGAYCDNSGMRLAEITSKAQAEALVNAFSADFKACNKILIVDTGYWIAGRDSHKLSQMVWNTTETEVNAAYIPFKENALILTCLAFNSLEDNLSHVGLTNCATKIGILCEFVPPS